jgi:hypothetical protein
MSDVSERQRDVRDRQTSRAYRKLIAELFVSLDGYAFSARRGRTSTCTGRSSAT